MTTPSLLTSTDVPCPPLFVDWIEELAGRVITRGCSSAEYCPSTLVARAQMATFVTKTFALTLYGP